MKIYGRKRGSNVAAVPFSLFFLLSGIYGVYLMFLAVPQLRWNRAAVFFLAALPAMLLWYLDGKKGTNRRGLLPAGIIVVPILIGAVLFFHPSVIEEIISAALQTAGFAEAGQMDVTRGVLMILWVFSYLLFLWEFVFRVHWFLYIFMSVLLLAAPLMGIVPGSGAVLCIGIFQITFWAVHTLMKKSRQGKKKRKYAVCHENRRHGHGGGDCDYFSLAFCGEPKSGVVLRYGLWGGRFCTTDGKASERLDQSAGRRDD